ncbi:undecaprenyl-phosphate glucose phosphotransferase [Pelagibius litoralis]|uniref:Undecaprenyl-phosphate glucose phosphotransferase n=2 Tax=Pelagibius litoralis TaxID=374515 RepID=A0A967C3L4_9PROT|nr:undecaprenyl-phosphate glucose phosphotransferase [Pelagibius litoralis]
MIIGLVGLVLFFIRQADDPSLYYPKYLGAIVLAMVVATYMLHRFDVYRDDFLFSKRIPYANQMTAWAVTFCVLLAAAFLIKMSDTYSRVWALSWFVGAGAGLVLGRVVMRQWVSGLAVAGRFANRTVILGAGEQGRRLAGYLQRHGDVNTKIIGFADDRSSRVPKESGGIPLLGNVDDLIRMIRLDDVDQVIVALPWTADRRLREVVRRLEWTPVPIRLAPDLAGFSFPDRGFTTVARLPMMRLFDRPISGWSFILKTIEDRFIAALLLIALLPVIAVVALAVKLDSPGPVFFRQKRYGFNNNLFDCWKFRTMHHHMADANAEVLTSRNDGRVTRIGRFLRKTSIDELPQLINVLTGDMSLVGPRPHATSAKADGHLYEDAVDAYAARHRVKPGITGWAQINGWRGETDTVEKIERRVEYDLFYIENWSLGFDLLILLRTAFVVLGHRDEAY